MSINIFFIKYCFIVAYFNYFNAILLIIKLYCFYFKGFRWTYNILKEEINTKKWGEITLIFIPKLCQSNNLIVIYSIVNDGFLTFYY